MTGIIDTQLKNVAWQYAQLLGARVTAATLGRRLEESPFYPSLLSLTRTFSGYDIPNKAFRVSEEGFHKMKPPFLALQRRTGSVKDFVLVTAVTGDVVSYIYEGSKRKTLSTKAFLNDFQGVVWMAEPGPESGDPHYKENLRQERNGRLGRVGLMAGACFIICLPVAWAFPVLNPIAFLILALLKLAGCVIACLLLFYGIDKNNPVIKNICASGDSKNNGCDAVLSSKAARIAGVGLGEIGFFYFAATTLLLVLPAMPWSNRLAWLAGMNLCAVPFIIFSLYYQWRVVKRWCKLCVASQAVLAAELGVFSILYWQRVYWPGIAVSQVCFVGGCIILPVVVWFTIKPMLTGASELAMLKPAYLRLKNDPGVFGMQLQQQPVIQPGWEHMGIVAGSPEPSAIVVMVSNPYCGPCALAHRQLHRLVQQNKDIQLRILFVNDDIPGDSGATTARHLMALAQRGDADMMQALGDWYTAMDYPAFAKKYPADAAVIAGSSLYLKDMHAWCKAAGISFTPAIYVNGHLLPESYGPGDLAALF